MNTVPYNGATADGVSDGKKKAEFTARVAVKK